MDLQQKNVYDANGQRIRKTVGSTSVDYLYDLGGHVTTELSSAGAWNRGEVFAGGHHLATYNNGTTYFIHADWLGTERVRTDKSGASCETVTSLPFGDGQSTSGSCGDPSPLHFTGKQRDAETGNDDFGARYLSSNMARWLTPDWSARGSAVPYADLSNPQSLNLYAYVLNNPITHLDADGHVPNFSYSGDCINNPPPGGGCGDPEMDDNEAAYNQQQQQPQTQQAAAEASAADKVKLALDVVGFVPVVGDFANAASAAISLAQGHYGEAAVSALAAVPLIGVAAEVAKGAKVAKEAEEAVSVYRIVKEGETTYVGITNNLARRSLEHGEQLEKVAGGLTRKQARGVEQALIEQHGLAKNGGKLTNKINSISKSSAIYNEAVSFGKQLLQSLKYVP